MKISDVSILKNEGGVLVTGVDQVEQVLRRFFSEPMIKEMESEIGKNKIMLSNCGSFRSIKYYIPNEIDIEIVLIDKAKELFLLRIIEPLSTNFDKQSEFVLAEEVKLPIALLSFWVKVKVEPIGNTFVFDFEKLLQLLRRSLPINHLMAANIVTSFKENYNIFTGVTEPFVVYQSKDIKLSLSIDREISERRFPTGCIRKVYKDVKDNWQIKGSTISGPLFSDENGLYLPTLIWSIEDIRSFNFQKRFMPIVDEKSKTDAENLAKIVFEAMKM